MSEDSKLNVVETRKIPTREGGTIEIQMSQAFINVLRQHFGLLESQPIEDDHVRMYVFGAVNTAVTKAERELKDVDTGETAG